ncbi:hypothetical protein RCO48_34535 [Peribacillus frigoritolerans]|nr:hypothetical protein [Peribacillus frigoritolerans]
MIKIFRWMAHIYQQKRDVTGDQKIDIIQVQGLPYEEGSKFLKKIELSVESNRRTIDVPLEAGYNPDLKVADLNNDGVQDVLVTVLMEGRERLISSYAYTFKDGKSEGAGNTAIRSRNGTIS